MAYYIGPRCSTCHYCFNECPAGAISFVGSSYQIDEFKCTSCGVCAEVCPTGIIYDPEKVTEPTPHDDIKLDCDLVVLGAGAAGMLAAVRAAQLTGKKVIVLEKAKKPGGNSTLGHGILMRYTKWHEKAGLPDIRPLFIEGIYENTGKVLDYEMLKNATYALSDAFDWMCELGGVEKYFEMKENAIPAHAAHMGGVTSKIDFPVRSQNKKCTDTSMGPGWMGTFIVEKMLETAKTLDVEVLCEHAAVELLTDSEGNFAGVVAEDPGGKTIVKANACVIATGGFAHNDELMKRLNPSFFSGLPVKRLSVPTVAGDGMKLITKIGGAIDLERVRVPAGGPVHHPWNYTVMTLSGFGNAQVDVNGNLFESEMHGLGANSSPIDTVEGGIIYQILDIGAVDRGGEDGIMRCTDPCAMEERKNYREALDKEAMNGFPVLKAWTLEGLADKIGCIPKTLVESIEKWNAMAEEETKSDKPLPPGPMGMPGMPKEKILKAPFYAIKCGRFSESASGGVVTDTYLNAVRTDGSLIKGLFAAGDSCRGLFLKDDSGGKFGELPWAAASGFMVGNYAAEYIK